jgi:tRNA-splicing ligase RtcB
MSRTSALSKITAQQLKDELQKNGVKLIGGGLDEAPFAYKDINSVMNAQKHLVETVGTFMPKIVKMDDTPPRNRKKHKEVVGE